MGTGPELTQLLIAWSDGNEAALAQLASQVQSELRRIARRYLHAETPGQLLQSTDLVNEAWLRLIDWKNVSWQNRAHFFSVAAQMMRRVLVDEARERNALKRGAGAIRVSFSFAGKVPDEASMELLAVDQALNRLAELDPRKSRIVELRFFGGMSVDEVAEVMNISPRTVMRDWNFAQRWLYNKLSK